MKRIEKNITFNCACLIQASFFSPSIHPVYSQEDLTSSPSTDDALDEELRYLQAETYVITASRIPESIKKSASSITVITDKEIRQMGPSTVRCAANRAGHVLFISKHRNVRPWSTW